MNCVSGVALALLGTGLVVVLTLEVIAVTLQWDRWEDQRKVLPQILETRTKLADFSAEDWVSDSSSNAAADKTTNYRIYSTNPLSVSCTLEEGTHSVK